MQDNDHLGSLASLQYLVDCLAGFYMPALTSYTLFASFGPACSLALLCQWEAHDNPVIGLQRGEPENTARLELWKEPELSLYLTARAVSPRLPAASISLRKRSRSLSQS